MVTPAEPKGLDESEGETKNLVCSCRRRMSERTPVDGPATWPGWADGREVGLDEVGVSENKMSGRRKLVIWGIGVFVTLAVIVGIIASRPRTRPLSLAGAVMRRDADPRKNCRLRM